MYNEIFTLEVCRTLKKETIDFYNHELDQSIAKRQQEIGKAIEDGKIAIAEQYAFLLGLDLRAKIMLEVQQGLLNEDSKKSV